MVCSSEPLDDTTFARKERVLRTYYERLNELDKSVRELTSFFFGINTAIVALVFQVVKVDVQRLILAIVGYCVSVTIYLVTWKAFLSWRLYAQDMGQIEDELDYDIARKYDARLAKTPGKAVRTTLVRMRFNFLFVLLWLLIIAYFVFSVPASWRFDPPQLYLPLGVLLIAVVAYAPWAYFAGTARPGVIWATLRALWAQEV